MARARNIKPSIMDNEELAELEPLTRLLFVYLWMLADREGRLEDRPKRIAAQALAYDRTADVQAMLCELELGGFISRYSARGVACIQITSFLKHQTPHGTEKDSQLPGLDGGLTVHQRGKNGYATGNKQEVNGSLTVNQQNTNTLIPDSGLPDTGYLIPDIPPTVAEGESTKAKSDYSDDFEEAWQAYPTRPGASKPDSFKAWKARIKEGVEPQALIDGVKRYARYCVSCGTEPGYVKQPATFFGPGQHYQADWTPPARASPATRENKHSAAARAIFGAPSPEFLDV